MPQLCGNSGTMGIMFHGTSSSCILPICRDGIDRFTSFTSSFHYAVRRSQRKDEYAEGKDKCAVKQAQVLVMAVLVESDQQLKSPDQRLREPYYSLPLFVLTVSVS